VTSNPSPAYVGRVAAAFNDNGAGVRGDMKAVIKAILLDPEARGSIKTDPDYGKLREPVLFVTNFLRPFNPQAETINSSACPDGRSDGAINAASSALFDQDVFNAPTVFNYYQLDGVVPNTNLSGAEFGIFSTATALKRANFVNQMTQPFGTAAPGILSFPFVNQPNYAPCGTKINLDRLLQFAQTDLTGGALVEELNRELLYGTMSAAVRNHIMGAIQAVSPANATKRVRTAVYLVATSSQFQVQR
jgi:hypothetical protein